MGQHRRTPLTPPPPPMVSPPPSGGSWWVLGSPPPPCGSWSVVHGLWFMGLGFRGLGLGCRVQDFHSGPLGRLRGTRAHLGVCRGLGV